MFHKGEITYYERKGIFLTNSYKPDLPEFTLDTSFVMMDKDEVYVSVTFLGHGAKFAVDNPGNMKVLPIFGKSFTLAKSQNRDISYTIRPGIIGYYDWDLEKMREASLPLKQYIKILQEISHCSIAKGDTYYIEWTENAGKKREIVCVEGKSALKIVEEIFEECYKNSPIIE